MDPNETLVRLRAAVERMRSALDESEERDAACEAAEAAAALDEWLSEGGFLPVLWRHA